MINKISNGMQVRPVVIKNQSKTIDYKPAMMSNLGKDSVSFGGINAGAAKLANSEEIAKVVSVARDVVGKKSKDVNKLISSAVSETLEGKSGAAVKQLSEKNSNIGTAIKTIADSVQKMASGEINDEIKTAQEMGKVKTLEKAKAALTPDGINSRAMGILSSTLEDYKAVEGGKFLKNENVHKVLKAANDNSAVFNAAFALGLAGVLRPATIYALPSKNKDDNAYAAGHSISSGLIGFGVSMLFNNPIAKAIKNVKANPEKYLKEDTIKNLGEVTKNGLAGKKVDIATKYINLGSELAIGIPQACLTIALVPIVLKNVFHLEKGKGKKADQQQNNTAQAQVQNDSKSAKKVGFAGAKKINPITHLISKGVAAVMNNKVAQGLFNKTAKSDMNIVQHLSAAKGLLISGMYAYRTLTNDKLDSERKRTLAINQIGVSLVSTVLGYTFSIGAGKKIDKIAEKFMAANIKTVTDSHKMNTLVGGIKAASSLMIFSTVYRYLSPVLVTPIANKLGEFINQKHAEQNQSQKA